MSALLRPEGAGFDPGLELAKGLGIILVVIGHAWRGLDTAGMIGDGDLFATIDQLIYAFHMPLFFLLSGLTFQAWARARPLGPALVSRVTRLLWPLILWTYVFTAARLAAGDAANAPVGSAADLWALPLPPRDHFWFLWALFLLHLAALIGIRTAGRPLGAPVWLGLALLALLVTSLVPLPLNGWTYGALVHAAVFLTGMALGAMGGRPRGAVIAAIACLAFIGLEVLSLNLKPSLLSIQVFGILLALAFLRICDALARILPHTLQWPLRLLAAASMGIYLSHTIFSAALRAALAPGITDLWLHLTLGTLAGLIGPLLIYTAIRKVGRPAWIGF